jgi:hypothetical protein
MYVFKLGHQMYKEPYGVYTFPYPVRYGIEGINSYITGDRRWQIYYLKDTMVRCETPMFVYENFDLAWDRLVEISKESRRIRLWVAETSQTFEPPCRILTDPDFYADEFWHRWFANKEQPPTYWDTWDYVTVEPPPGTKICYDLTLRAKMPTHRELHNIGYAILEASRDEARWHFEEFLKHR